LVACGDNNLVEPEPALSPELSVAHKKGGMGNVVKMVPFKVTANWWYASAGDASICDAVPGTAAIQFIEWEGTATHMGKVTGTNVNCFGPGDPMSRSLLAHTGAITAANGDVLTIFGTRATVTVFPDFSFEIGPADFAGGTGRFENATGWYQLYGEDAIGAGPGKMVGEISSVGSSK
jgi:hypothetical protein